MIGLRPNGAAAPHPARSNTRTRRGFSCQSAQFNITQHQTDRQNSAFGSESRRVLAHPIYTRFTPNDALHAVIEQHRTDKATP